MSTNESPPTKESELEPDDLIQVERLEVKCTSCQAYCERDRRSDLDSEDFTAYVYRCSSSRCAVTATLMVPRSSAAQRRVPLTVAAKETELEPDDSFSIAQVDVLYREGGVPCARQGKEREGDRTSYHFWPVEDGQVVQVLVPLG